MKIQAHDKVHLSDFENSFIDLIPLYDVFLYEYFNSAKFDYLYIFKANNRAADM